MRTSTATKPVGVPARFDRANQFRRAMTAKIQIARKELAMDEDDYRQGLFDQTGKLSLTQCSDRDLDKVLTWLKSKGFKPLPGKRAAAHPMARKARAMWISLYHLGVVHNSSEQALEAFACRQLKCERMAWARQSDAYQLIEALKAMAIRNGWLQHSVATQKPLDPLGLQRSLCMAIVRRLKDAQVIPDDWELHIVAWRLCGEANAHERAWSAEDYAALAAKLGAKLRELAPNRLGGTNG